MDGSDEYRSILYEYDRAGRRTIYSDPTLGQHPAREFAGVSVHGSPGESRFNAGNYELVEAGLDPDFTVLSAIS